MKDIKISNFVESIPESGLEEFFNISNTIEDVVSLGVGEPDFATPTYIREAAIKELTACNTKYTATHGINALRKAVRDYLQKFDLYYESNDQILITIGASEGIDVALRALINPGDEVLYAEPCYVSYLPGILMAGGIPTPLSTSVKHAFKLIPEQLSANLSPKSKILMLSYPNNPTGAIMEKEDLEKIAALVIEHDLFVISDEIYAELTYGQKHVSIASLPGMSERTLVISGFSKAFAMTGWRLGYAAGSEKLIKAMNKIHQYSVMTAGTVSQYAGVEALTNPNRDREIEKMRKAYDHRRTFMLNAFRSMGLECFEPLGAFYVFPSIQSTGLSSEEFANHLLTKEKAAVIAGNCFGKSGEGYLRCSYAYSIEDIAVCLEKIERFVKRVKGK